MKKYICRHPACMAILDQPGYCSQHAKPEQEKAKAKPFQAAVRYNTSLYNTHRWRMLRIELIKAAGCCQYCGRQHNLQVHHIRRPKGNQDLFYDRANLVVICSFCHSQITALETRETQTHRGVQN